MKSQFDFGTIIGLVAGLLCIFVSMIWPEVDRGDIILSTGDSWRFEQLMWFFQPQSVFIVLGGVLSATLVNYPIKAVLNIGSVFKNVILSENFDFTGTIDKIVVLAEKSRKDGLLSLEADLNDIDSVFLRNGVELAINENTKAIVAVHLYGNLCAMDRLLSIGQRHSIPVIEDAAEGIGSIYKGNPAGSMGLFGSFSFHGSKTLTTGEGGMFVTNDMDLYQKVLTLSNHGRDQKQELQFWPDVIGYKYKMSNLQAAVGCAQIERRHAKPMIKDDQIIGGLLAREPFEVTVL